jgi:SAM-dependent methyltransferase
MRAFWDDAARRNAAWYVDTSLDYTQPDMDHFFASGRGIVAAVLDDAPCRPAGRTLAVEIGSGLGRMCAALAERFDRVVGVDIAPEMVRQARQLVPNPAVTFDVTDGTHIPAVADGEADLVFSFTVFQHIPSLAMIEGYIVEAGRVLAPGGVLVFQWNNEPGELAWRMWRAVLATLQRTGLRREPFDRHDLAFLGSRVPWPKIERALHRAGLDPCGTQSLGSLYAWAWARKPA